MLTAKLLHQKFSSAHGHLTTGYLCLQVISVMLNTSSISLSHKTPKSQRSLNFDKGSNKACAINM